MNKIYKVVWNAARNCYVVGSEFISKTRRGEGYCHSVRRGGTKALAAAMTVLALTAGYGVLPVQGAEIPVQVTIDPSSDPEEYVVGVEGSALAEALDGQEVDVTITSFKNAGLVAGTTTTKSTLFGNATAKNNMILGDGAEIYVQGALGKAASVENSMAIGQGAEIHAQSQGSAKHITDSIAFGQDSYVSASNSVAIGAGSTATEEGVVSAGSANNQRRIVNVADGNIGENSIDAVNGSQLYAVREGAVSYGTKMEEDLWGNEKEVTDYSIVTLRGENGTKLTNLAAGEFKDGSTDAVTAGQLYDAGIVPGKAADGSVAIGEGSTVTSGAWDWDTNTPLPANGVAIGDNAKVNYSAVNGVAIGQGAEVRTDNATAIGQGSRVVSGDGSVALGQGSMVTAADAKGTDAHGVVSVGLTGNKETEGFTRRIINVADGTSDSDAATYGQVKDVDAKIGDLDFSNTHSLKKAENVTDALTKLDTKAYDLSGKFDDFSRSGIMAGGTRDSRNAGTNSIQLGNQARAAGQNSIAFGAGASVTGENTEESILTRAKNNGVAIGYSATAAGFNTTVLGAAAKAQGDNATALGQGALVTANNSVALGAGSRVTTDDIRDSDTNGVVSVGKSDGERRIINVADGVNDSDAATVGQISKITGMDSEKGNVVQYNGEDKSTITFAGTNGTALNNVNDIVMNVKNPINKKTEQHSFQNAGLLPGKVEGTATSGKWNMAIGEGSEVAVDDGTGANMKFNTAIGNSAGVSQNIVNGDCVDVERSTAIGHAAKVSASNSTAIGDSSNAGEDNSVAIGQKAEVQSATSIAIGQGTKIGSNAENSIAIGTSAVGSKAKNSTVVGVNAWSMAEGGTVLGKSAKIQGSAANGTAIGTNATINVSAGSGNVALGADSTVSKADVGDDTEHGVVSVGQSGDKGFNRRIINVADGVNDSDAATVKQVKAVQGDVEELNKLAVTYTDDTKKAVNFNGATLKNVGDIQIGNAQSTFVGSGLVNGKVYDTDAGQWAENGANATHSMAVGSKSSVRGTDSVAVGPEAAVNNGNAGVLEQSTAVGSKATVSSSFSTALGAHTQAKGDYSVAVGAQSQTTGANATAIGAYAVAGENSVVVGGGEGLAAPTVSKANSTAMGTYVDIKSDNGTALGYGSQIGWDGKNSVALGADSVANEENVVSVGHTKGQTNGLGGTYGEDLNRRITNVADGKNANDAATVGQISKITGMDSGKGNVVQYDGEDKSVVTFAGANGTKLTNLADGEFKTGSTDAVTAGQLYAAGITPGDTRGNAGSVAMGGGYNNYVLGNNGTAIGYNALANENAVAIGNSAGAGHLNATAVGQNSNAMEEGATALGQHAWAEVKNATAIGFNSDVAFGGDNSVALGANTQVIRQDILETDTNGVVSVGYSGKGFGDDEAFNRRIINVADGVNDSDAATVGQIKTITGIDSAKGNVVQYDNESKDQITFGGANGTALLNISNLSAKTATIGNISFAADGRITNVTAGQDDNDVATVGQIKNLTGLDSTQGSVVQYDKDGNLDVAVGDSGLNVDDTAASLSHGANSVSVGADGTTVTGDLNVTGDLTFNGETVSSDDLANAANVAGDVSDIKEQIGAGADGKLGLTNEQTTLVGGINANTEAINGVKTIVGDGKLDNGAADLTAGINANSAAIEQNRQAIGALGSRVSDLGEEVDSVGAISAALAGLHPLDYNGTGSKFQISAALGTYDGTQAAAIGGFYHFNRDTLLSIGGSTSFEGDRKTAANVGVTFRVGEGASEAPAVQDNETKQQMEAMKQEIEMLKAELEQLKNKDTEGTNDKN